VLIEWLDSGCVDGLAIDEYCITYCVMPTVLYLVRLDLGRPPFLVIRLTWDILQSTKPIRIWHGYEPSEVRWRTSMMEKL
jgi:hypothetical protein